MKHVHGWGLETVEDFYTEEERGINGSHILRQRGVDRTYRCYTCGETKLKTKWGKKRLIPVPGIFGSY